MGLFRESGGGFLNGENGTIVGLKFEIKAWETSTEFSAEVSVLRDGAEEAVPQFLRAGFVNEGHGIADDGQTLEGGLQVGAKTEFARFIQSMMDAGFEESNFPVDGSNFSAIIGQRVTFGKEPDVERQMAAGRKKLGKVKAASATDAEIMAAGKRQDKKDKTKSYNHDRLIVTAVLGEAMTAAVKSVGKTTAPKSAAAKSGKANGAAASTSDDTSVIEAAEGALLTILGTAKDNSVPKGSLSSKVVNYALENNLDGPDREALRKLVTSEAFLQRQTGWTFDGKMVVSA